MLYTIQVIFGIHRFYVSSIFSFENQFFRPREANGFSAVQFLSSCMHCEHRHTKHVYKNMIIYMLGGVKVIVGYLVTVKRKKASPLQQLAQNRLSLKLHGSSTVHTKMLRVDSLVVQAKLTLTCTKCSN